MAAEITLKEVDAFVASSARSGMFPPPIEAAYRAQQQTYRSKALRAGILPALIVYNLFLPVDCYLMPATAGLAVLLHLVVSGWIVATKLLLDRDPPRGVREMIAVSGPVLMSLQILAICALNDGSATSDYRYLAIMITIYMNVNVRPDFFYALAASILLWLVFLASIVSGETSLSAKLIGSFSMAAGAYLTLAANWRMERDVRHIFVRRMQDQLRRAHAEKEAGRDALTGLLNRRQLEKESERIWAGARPGSNTAVIMCDVDHFKAYNDRYGHPAGDLCLKRVAAAILAEMRNVDDLAVRIGGEEFLVLLPDADMTTAVETAERIRRALQALSIPHEGVPLGSTIVTASLGVMAGSASVHSLSEIIAGADAALYAAKRNGRNRVWPALIAQVPSVPVLRGTPVQRPTPAFWQGVNSKAS